MKSSKKGVRWDTHPSPRNAGDGLDSSELKSRTLKRAFSSSLLRQPKTDCTKIEISFNFVFCARRTSATIVLAACTKLSCMTRVQPEAHSHNLASSPRTNAQYSQCAPTSAPVPAPSAPGHSCRPPHFLRLHASPLWFAAKHH